MSSDLLDKLIKALTVLPGVGKKSAQRMALYLLDKNKSGAKEIASSLSVTRSIIFKDVSRAEC